jgi:hypothetical protein
MKRLLIAAALVVVACKQPPAAVDGAAPAKTGDPPATCTQLGAPCTVAPGKLGTCVEIEKSFAVSGGDAAGEYQFTCQSQH